MSNRFILLLVLVIIASCNNKKQEDPKQAILPTTDSLTEFSTIYTTPVKKTVYSTYVKDSFGIFQSIPSDYNKDSAKKYPLIILLDANVFFEPLLASIKFSTGVGDMEESIITGIAYKDLPSMDSIRSRDYTYPKAIPEYEMALSGGADHFKDFIDKELLPQIKTDYKIDSQKIILCGHSLGGYFVLYYLLQSAAENKYTISNFISASPSLHYNHRYLFGMEDSLSKKEKTLTGKLYISMGSRDMNDKESKNILGAFNQQVLNHHYNNLNIHADEYSNFGHMDAALPGFTKGLTFIFAK
jgi:uncharacterized protein